MSALLQHRPWVLRVARAHPRMIAAFVCGAAVVGVLQLAGFNGRLIVGWDAFAVVLMTLTALQAAGAGPAEMAANAEAQDAGEWTVFWVTVLGISASFVAVVSEFSDLKDASSGMRHLRVSLVAITLAVSWIATHVVFALRYAHEYYEAAPGGLRGGLVFPDEPHPDYWDFLYFAGVIGMTFQVSDVQIADRRLRRLALVHGILAFAFNTIIVALTVNLAAGLL